MKNFEKSVLSMMALSLLLFISGCQPTTELFKFSTDVKKRPQFFLPLFDSTLAESRRLIENVDTILVYRTVFREYQIEHNNILDFTTINDSSDLSKYKIARYKQFKGDWTEIYLFQLKSSTDPKDGFVYFSSKFKEDPHVDTVGLGFGPSYFGRISERLAGALIILDQELDPKKRRSGYSLKKKSKRNFMKSGSLIFVLGSWKEKDHITITKIVNTGKNKIGGDKDLVYDVATVFSDPNALKFKYHSTILTKP